MPPGHLLQTRLSRGGSPGPTTAARHDGSGSAWFVATLDALGFGILSKERSDDADSRRKTGTRCAEIHTSTCGDLLL